MKGKDTADGQPAANPMKIPRKQAVVIIHGMGEQRPMDTLRGFARAVWTSDKDIKEIPDAALGPDHARERTIAPRDVAPPEPEAAVEEAGFFPSFEGQLADGYKPKRAWMAPDTRTGSHELHRMTTGMAEKQYRVDFYELYWADIMQGTTLDHLKGWFTGLLLRWPRHVPRDVAALWVALWVVLFFIVLLALLAAPDLAKLLGFGDFADKLDIAPPSVKAALSSTVGDWVGSVDGAMSRGAALLRGMLYLLPLVMWFYWVERISASARRDGDKRLLATFLSHMAAFALALGGIALIAFAFPVILKISGQMLASFVALAIVAAINSFLLPYFGDVARYVQASPGNVAKRGQVRERGMKLLRALHGVDGDGNFAVGDPTYGRIVLVGHSLGSIVAYDLLMQFWAEAGPLKSGLEGAMKEAVDEMEAYLDPDRRKGAFTLETFQEKQHAVMAAMRASGEPFRITDLVTIGSPLTHAEFLVAHDKFRFDYLVRERLLSKSPPYPYEDGKETVSYLAKKHDGVETRMVHHAAPFAAVRWTNIYDKRQWILGGDFVSGPLRENFGAGLADIRVVIHRKVLGLWTRIFTHTLYWDVESRGKEAQGNRTHVGLVRDAVRLDAYHDFYPEGAVPAFSYPSAAKLPGAETVGFG